MGISHNSAWTWACFEPLNKCLGKVPSPNIYWIFVQFTSLGHLNLTAEWCESTSWPFRFKWLAAISQVGFPPPYFRVGRNKTGWWNSFEPFHRLVIPLFPSGRKLNRQVKWLPDISASQLIGAPTPLSGWNGCKH